MFVVERASHRHSGGTKDYHLVLIENTDNGRFLLVQRWAKKGQWGNGIKPTQHENGASARGEWNKVIKQKFRAGEYDEELKAQGGSFTTVEELKKHLGQYWMKLGSNLEWLIPGVGMGDVEPEETAEWSNKEGRMVTQAEIARRREAQKAIDRAEKAQREAESEAAYKSNPTWGIF